jgi:hypothetical protein
MLIVLVTGGRSYFNRRRVFAELDRIYGEAHGKLRIVHGGAKGADALADAWCKRNHIDHKAYPAAWGDLTATPRLVRYHFNGAPYNALAGANRNQQMLDEEPINFVLAFPGGTGTADMVRRAKAAGIANIREVNE